LKSDNDASAGGTQNAQWMMPRSAGHVNKTLREYFVDTHSRLIPIIFGVC